MVLVSAAPGQQQWIVALKVDLMFRIQQSRFQRSRFRLTAKEYRTERVKHHIRSEDMNTDQTSHERLEVKDRTIAHGQIRVLKVR